MVNQPKWGAKLAFACALALIGAVLTVYGIFGFGVFQFTTWHIMLDLPFPSYIVVTPIIQVILLTITIMFARYAHASLKELGFKRTSPKILASVSVALIPLFLFTAVVTLVLTSFFGPDPMAEAYTKAAMPTDSFQLVAYVIISIILVGPVEELAFRGFVQQGFENSFGKMNGLLIASALFGLPHFANYPYNAATAFAGGLVLGYVWQKTDQNTTATAVIHGIFNSIGIILIYLGII
ncbi:MAG: CPBP family intramembrane metalloprotease [Candidatus Methylarchaceae archaeon HK02M2]|nr:CPBP family intramembrane metalloprotease [Candidatus Methylarchaceae archaeon HK02M2]